MTRWKLEQLVDYARGLSSDPERAAIERDIAADRRRYLAGPPAGLLADLDLLGEISAVLRTAAEPSPGPSADTLFSLSTMAMAARGRTAGLPLLPVLNVHDPNAGRYSGYRSAQLGHRDLEIHGERFDLDLSVDTPYDAIDVVIVGRIKAGARESWSVERLPAILVAGERVLAAAVTNKFGEFHVAAQSEAEDVELCLLVLGEGQIRIPIDRRAPNSPLSGRC